MSGAAFDVEKLFGTSLQLKGKEFPVSNLKDKVVALYFSAHWCPPCKAFTPTLIAAYNAAKAAGANFELIFVSSDQDDEGFDEYYADMPWPAVKFDDEETREKLGTAFGVKGIPSLQVVGKDGKLITSDGRSVVTKDKEGAFKSWSA